MGQGWARVTPKQGRIYPVGAEKGQRRLREGRALPSGWQCRAWKNGWDLGMCSWRGGCTQKRGKREPRHRVGNLGRVSKGRWSSMRMWTQTRALGTSVSASLAPRRGIWFGCACGIRILSVQQALNQCPPESGSNLKVEQSGASLHHPAQHAPAHLSHLKEAFSTRPFLFSACPCHSWGSLSRGAPYPKPLPPSQVHIQENCVLKETKPNSASLPRQ